MTTEKFHILDTMKGDRVLGPDEIANLLLQTGSVPTSTLAEPPPIGNTTPNSGAFTTMHSTELASLDAGVEIGTGTRTAVAVAGAATLNKPAGKITSEALTTAKDATYTLTLTNDQIAAGDIVLASVALGSATKGSPTIQTVTPGSNQAVIVVKNLDAADAIDGTIVISFVATKQT